MCPRPGRTCTLFRVCFLYEWHSPAQIRSANSKRKSSLRVIYQGLLIFTPRHAGRSPTSTSTHFTRRPSSTRLAPTDCGPFEPRPEVWPVGSFNSVPQKKDGKPINVYVLAYRARLPYPSWAQLVRATLCWNAKTKYHPFMSMFVACTDRYTVTRRIKRGKKK